LVNLKLQIELNYPENRLTSETGNEMYSNHKTWKKTGNIFRWHSSETVPK